MESRFAPVSLASAPLVLYAGQVFWPNALAMIDIPQDFRAMLQKYDLLNEFIHRQRIGQLIDAELMANRDSINAQLGHHSITSEDVTAVHSDRSEEKSTVETYRNKLSRYKQNQFSGLAKVFFLKNRQTFDMVSYGHICVAERSMAYELYFRILDDAQSFWSLATQYSQDPSVYHGGVIGPVRVSEIAPAFADQLLAMKPATVCQPFLLDELWHMLYLSRYQRSALTAEVYRQIIDILFDQHIAERLDKLEVEFTQPSSRCQ